MKIRKKFLQLTKMTYPYGKEGFLESYLPVGYQKDPYGNYFFMVGSGYTTMFTCHLDTASKGEMLKVQHTFDKNFIKTDGKTILGADDKAGMVVLLYMIEKQIPGLYYFFIGEEVGCIGSSDLASDMERGHYHIEELKNITKVVSFDRRGTSSVITEQFYGVCCSDDFAKELCYRLNLTNHGLKMLPDDTGMSTDSAQFLGIIPECTNISVGYYNEHTTKECQDILYLYRLCYAVSEICWETLPVKREPYKFDWSEFESLQDKSPNLNSEYSEYSEDYYTFVTKNGKKEKAYISKTWISHETIKIISALKSVGDSYSEVMWDGTTCWVSNGKTRPNIYLGNRSDLCIMIDDFDKIPLSHIKYSLS